MTEYLAHSENGDGQGLTEPLRVHLQYVADRAAGYAAAFGCHEHGWAAGLLHDLGKYSDQFLRRLEEPRCEPARDHWSMGAVIAASGARCGIPAALAIAAHHTGLDFLVDDPNRFSKIIVDAMREEPYRFTETSVHTISERFSADGFSWPSCPHNNGLSGNPAADMLDVRMLYSALVDADFIETEAHFNGDSATPRQYRPDGPAFDFRMAVSALHEAVGQIRQGTPPNPMNSVRDQLFSMCVDAAKRYPTGLFTLSAPTGSAKTLAMLAFALHHAVQHSLRRVVLVMPFLNIIEQTASIYRRLFSPRNGFDYHTVVEHHSLANDRDSKAIEAPTDGVGNEQRLFSENWDAPVILTTTVQCLESLLANRPSDCRKLHRLARSVILFDEVQTLPPKLAKTTLATLSRLADPGGPYESSIVFATATQPAFDVLNQQVTKLVSSGWNPTELVSDPEPMFTVAANRTRIMWKHHLPVTLRDLSKDLAQNDQVLCIVNLKRHAILLATELRDRAVKGLCHLSTNMCPAHRKDVLRSTIDRLNRNRPVRLIATQCVEAGVDLDFPLVYRAFAPLEAIAQATGRCNRHSLRDTERVVIFDVDDDRGRYPPGYTAGVEATKSFLAQLQQDGLDLNATEIVNSPERLRSYFRFLYGLSGRASGVVQDEEPLLNAISAGDFAEVAKLYRLIDNNTINVLVRYDIEKFDRLVDDLRGDHRKRPGFVRQWIRRATPHSVSLFRPARDASLWNHLEPVQFGRRREEDAMNATWFVTSSAVTYDPLFGFVEPEFAESWIA